MEGNRFLSFLQVILLFLLLSLGLLAPTAAMAANSSDGTGPSPNITNGTRLPTFSDPRGSTLTVTATVSTGTTTVFVNPGRTTSIVAGTASPASRRTTSAVSRTAAETGAETVATPSWATWTTAPVTSWVTTISPSAPVNTSISSFHISVVSGPSLGILDLICISAGIGFVLVTCVLLRFQYHRHRGTGPYRNRNNQPTPGVPLRTLAPGARTRPQPLTTVSTQKLLATE